MKNSNMYFKIFISILVIIYGYGIMDVNENYQILINRVYKNFIYLSLEYGSYTYSTVSAFWKI